MRSKGEIRWLREVNADEERRGRIWGSSLTGAESGGGPQGSGTSP